MRRILFSLAVILAAIAAAMPYVTGKIAEKVSARLVDQLNANSGYGELTIQEYRRGYADSEARFSWRLNNNAPADSQRDWIVDCRGRHGVLSFRYRCQAQDLHGYSDFVKAHLDGHDPLSLGGKVSVFGKLTHWLKSEAFSVMQDNGESFSVMPAIITLISDRKLSDFEIDGEFAGLSAHGNNGLLEVKALRINGKIKRGQAQLALGNIAIAIESLRLESLNYSNIDINKLILSGAAEQHGEYLDIFYQLDLGELSQTDPQIEGVPQRAASRLVENLNVVFKMSGIDIEQLFILNEKFEARAERPESASNAALLEMLPEFEGILISGLSFNSTVTGEYSSEPVNIEVDLQLVDNLTLGDFLLMRVNPGNVFAKINAEINTVLPTSLVAENHQLNHLIIDSVWFERTKDSYTSYFKMLRDEINLNGRALSNEELLALVRPAKKRRWEP